MVVEAIVGSNTLLVAAATTLPITGDVGTSGTKGSLGWSLDRQQIETY